MRYLAKSCNGHAQGFTITELLVVISIISILAGLGIFEYRQFRERYQIESQTRELYISLMNARVRAMQKNRMHFVVLENLAGGSTRYTIYEDTNPPPDGDENQNAGDTVFVQKTQDTPYSLMWSGGNQKDIDTKGIASAGTGNIYVAKSTGAEYDCVVISATRINMGKWDGSTCKDK